MSYLDNIHTQSLKLAHHALHGAQGEDGQLMLMQHSESVGGLTELLSLNAGQFTVERLHGDLDGVSDAATTKQRLLTIPGETLTETIRNKMRAIRWAGAQWKFEVVDEPESLQRNWRLLLTDPQKV